MWILGTEGQQHTLLEQDAFEQRVRVSKHQALISRGAMAVLKAGKRVFALLDRSFELFDIFGASFAERSLSLSVALLALFGSSIDLIHGGQPQYVRHVGNVRPYRLPSAFSFRRLRRLLRNFGNGIMFKSGLHRTRRVATLRVDLILTGGSHCAVYETVPSDQAAGVRETSSPQIWDEEFSLMIAKEKALWRADGDNAIGVG